MKSGRGAAALDRSAAALHRHGSLAAREGRGETALAFLTQAIAITPRDPELACDLGNAFQRTGQLGQAGNAYLLAIANAPTCVTLYTSLAENLRRRNLLREAMAVCDEAIRLAPVIAESHVTRGRILLAANRNEEALEAFERAAQLDPGAWKTHHGASTVHLARRNITLAVTRFKLGLRHAPTAIELHVGLGLALLRLGALTEAIAAFQSALAINPYHVEAAQQLVLVLEWSVNKGDAVGAWCSLGAALAMEDRFDEAATAYREALARKPDCLRALVRLGHLCLSNANPGEAVTCYEQALAIDPQHSRVHRGLGSAYLSLGQYARGWDELALDRCGAEGRQRDYEQPSWNGQAAREDTILVWADQGLGDTIQFLRYLPLTKQLCKRLLVECDPIVRPLLERVPGVDQILVRHAPLAPFDQQVTFHGLARIFEKQGLTLSEAVPYLPIDHALIEWWRERLGARDMLTVGIVWAGEPERKDGRFRFIPLTAFSLLSTVPKLRIISLQLGAPVAELLAPPDGLRVEELIDKSSTIVDTAALVENLDLVITIDTMMAHLAGALGKAVWLLLPYAAEWRWEVSGDTSRWYPTMRLFRQSRPGDWSGVLERVRDALGSVDCASRPPVQLEPRHAGHE